MIHRLFRKAAKSFDRVKCMVTRKLPLPDLGDTGHTLQFTARRDEMGYWTVVGHHNISTITDGVEKINDAYRSVISRHTGVPVADLRDSMRMTFDTAFIILREMEEITLAHHHPSALGPEPVNHYMGAYRLLPENLRVKLDARFHDSRPAAEDDAATAVQKSLPAHPGKPAGGLGPN